VLLLIFALLLSYAAFSSRSCPSTKSNEELQEKLAHFDSLMKGVSALGDSAIATALIAIAMLTLLRRQ
jgi:hypothetical protein